MKIARIEHEGSPRCAVIEEDHARLARPGVEVLELLGANPDEREAQLGQELRPLASTRLLAPIEPASFRDFSVFEQHVEGIVKMAGPDARIPEPWYEAPICYFSNPHAITGPGDEIAVPPGCELLDLELEVAIVIGRPGRNVSVEDAPAYIAGYTIWNDWSARDIGNREMRLPFGQCKGKDFANTLGPWLVSADEIEAHRDGDRLDLRMSASVNGVALGEDTLANMAWSFEEIIAFASRGAWIKPGDVIGSGTCGYGCLAELWGTRGRHEPAPLAPGDLVELDVQGIGRLTNTVTAGPAGVTLPPARPGRRLHRAAVAA